MIVETLDGCNDERELDQQVIRLSSRVVEMIFYRPIILRFDSLNGRVVSIGLRL